MLKFLLDFPRGISDYDSNRLTHLLKGAKEDYSHRLEVAPPGEYVGPVRNGHIFFLLDCSSGFSPPILIMYQAIVCRIKTRSHPNADKIALGLCLGNQVVIDINTPDNSLGVYFNTDGQLSEEFCKAHDLIAYKDSETGEKKGGFFDHRRRVRSQKFRGEISDGFWCPISHLAFTGVDLFSLKEGDVFTELNGIPICNKYVTQATREAKGKSAIKANRRQTPMFPAHYETEQFRFYAEKIPAGAVLSISLKMHGTSARITHTLDNVKPNRWQSLWSHITRKPFDKQEWVYLSGSRNVILERKDKEDGGFYGSEEFRYNATKHLIGNLHKGEIVYGEIVGWVDQTRPIMPSVKTDILKDKTFAKTYGEHMFYKYGCPAGTAKFYIYRIAYATVDGHVIDLPWEAVKQRASQLATPCVPEIVAPFIYDGDVAKLRELIEAHTNGSDPLDASHIREGVVLRVEHGLEIQAYKNKSFTFGVLEGYIRDDSNYVDAEEST